MSKVTLRRDELVADATEYLAPYRDDCIAPSGINGLPSQPAARFWFGSV